MKLPSFHITPAQWLDLAFCLVALPLLSLVYPVERWAYNFPWYVAIVAVWLYGLYVTNRAVTVPWLFSAGRKRAWAIGVIVLSVVGTFVLAGITLYDPRQNDYPTFERILPPVLQYGQAVWSLYMLVEAASFGIGVFARMSQQATAAEGATSPHEGGTPEPMMPEVVVAKQEVITVRSQHRNVPVTLSTILYVEAMDNYVRIHRLGLPTLTVQASMNQMLTQLSSDDFVRIHRSYIVSRAHIESYTSTTLRLRSLPTPLPIGRTYRHNPLVKC
ncbi:MAG: LytTR family transcriptional regulator DNA-binding domain-containing protein [Bacteroidales bacterium]|nr:LytTR family transcriptional regulator DNA-binding domain-containing protein [Bacteroidales bacterium]